MKIKGIKKVSGQSKRLRGYYNPNYLQLNFDRNANEVWADQFSDYGHGSVVVYHNPDIINCGIICHPVRMVEVKQMVLDTLAVRQMEWN